RLARTVPPVPPRKLIPGVPKELDAICQKAMALRKEDRYQTAQALTEDVQRYLAGEPVTAYHENFWERSWRWIKRHRVALGRVAAAVLLLGVVGFGVAKVREAQAETEAAEQARKKSEREAAELQRQKQARADVEAFRRLADEAQHYAAFQDPGAEHVPYFDL